MQDFVHLHVHTQYSLLDGQASVSKLVDKAMKDGMKGIAITDHGNMFGIKEFTNYVNKKNSGPKGEIKDFKKKIASIESGELECEDKEAEIADCRAKIAEAEAAYTKAGELGESSDAAKQLTNLYLRLANSYYKAQKYNDAVVAAEKSISYNANNANAYLIAANSSQKGGNNDAAISYFEKYISMPKAKNVNAYTFTIAVLYQQAGNKEKAIEYYQKVASDAQYGTQAQEQLKALQQ